MQFFDAVFKYMHEKLTLLFFVSWFSEFFSRFFLQWKKVLAQFNVNTNLKMQKRIQTMHRSKLLRAEKIAFFPDLDSNYFVQKAIGASKL